uniref:Uncharacterized protein n=1 Tax=Romanomermis culicivorax TaxID=13658 RepID=A0A915HHV4_ROMCU
MTDLNGTRRTLPKRMPLLGIGPLVSGTLFDILFQCLMETKIFLVQLDNDEYKLVIVRGPRPRKKYRGQQIFVHVPVPYQLIECWDREHKERQSRYRPEEYQPKAPDPPA